MRVYRILAVAVLGATCLSGCVFSDAWNDTELPREKLIDTDDLVGTWCDDEGGNLVLEADGSFQAENLLGDYTTRGPGDSSSEEAGPRSGSGDWVPVSRTTFDEERIPFHAVNVTFDDDNFATFTTGEFEGDEVLWTILNSDLQFSALHRC